MKKIIFLLLFFAAIKTLGQGCLDTNAYSYQNNCAECYGLDFAPVCGCDNNNYRTECEAFKCHNLLQDSSTICDYVDFEFRPTLFSNTPNVLISAIGRICVYVKYSGSAVIQIYNSFGKVVYDQLLVANYNDVFLPGNIFRGSSPEYLEIPDIVSFERGFYIVVVTVDRQSKTKKILKM